MEAIWIPIEPNSQLIRVRLPNSWLHSDSRVKTEAAARHSRGAIRTLNISDWTERFTWAGLGPQQTAILSPNAKPPTGRHFAQCPAGGLKMASDARALRPFCLFNDPSAILGSTQESARSHLIGGMVRPGGDVLSLRAYVQLPQHVSDELLHVLMAPLLKAMACHARAAPSNRGLGGSATGVLITENGRETVVGGCAFIPCNTTVIPREATKDTVALLALIGVTRRLWLRWLSSHNSIDALLENRELSFHNSSLSAVNARPSTHNSRSGTFPFWMLAEAPSTT